MKLLSQTLNPRVTNYPIVKIYFEYFVQCSQNLKTDATSLGLNACKMLQHPQK